MATNFRRPIDGDARLLLRVPKKAIVDYLLVHVDRSTLTDAFKSIESSTGELSETALGHLSHSDLVRVFLGCNTVPLDAARRLYSEYRYRGMKSLYLYECPGLPADGKLDQNAFNETLHRLVAEYRKQQTDYCFSELKISNLEDTDDFPQSLFEYPYSYVATIQVIDPQTAYPRLVEDLRSGFVWLKPDESWVAVCTRDEAINQLLVTALERVLQCTFRVLYIPKSAIRQLEPLERIRRATLHNPRTGTRRRWTNPQLANDEQAMQELKLHDEHDESPTSGYNQMLPDKTKFALGYNGERGRIFFSRDLTTTQMRSWGPAKIRTIAETVGNLCASQPQEIIETMSSQILKRVPVDIRDAVVELAAAVAICRQERLSETQLPRDSVAYAKVLKDKVKVVFRVNCSSCEGPSDVQCTCGETDLSLDGDELVCSSCRSVIPADDLHCVEGHNTWSPSLESMTYTLPLSNLTKWVGELVTAATGKHTNNDEEDFYVRGTYLHYSNPDHRVVYDVDEIPELASLLEDTVPEDCEIQIKNAIPGFREKFPCASEVLCPTCITVRQNPHCYIRLFGLLDREFTPRPHQGHEFGDYARRVTLDGVPDRQLVITMKSGKPSGRAVTQRSHLGRDIYSQVDTYFHDARVDIVGICVPQRLDDGFKAVLRTNARLNNKKLIFLDASSIYRIVYSVMKKHALALSEV